MQPPHWPKYPPPAVLGRTVEKDEESGRRAAWLTLGGFGGTVLVLVVYFLRHAA